jgi:hypothetical protein
MSGKDGPNGGADGFVDLDFAQGSVRVRREGPACVFKQVILQRVISGGPAGSARRP